MFQPSYLSRLCGRSTAGMVILQLIPAGGTSHVRLCCTFPEPSSSLILSQACVLRGTFSIYGAVSRQVRGSGATRGYSCTQRTGGRRLAGTTNQRRGSLRRLCTVIWGPRRRREYTTETTRCSWCEAASLFTFVLSTSSCNHDDRAHNNWALNNNFYRTRLLRKCCRGMPLFLREWVASMCQPT